MFFARETREKHAEKAFCSPSPRLESVAELTVSSSQKGKAP
jgi:hypothetical protein